MPITVAPQEIPDVLLITPARFGDARGFFSEVFNAADLATHGVNVPFVQDNHSLSAPVGVLRGLHFQTPPFAQDKLVRVVRGAILDVAVDIRAGSPSFGRHVAVELSAQNWGQLFVPKGFAHGFVTRTPDTEVIYKVTAPYAPANDAGILWNDPDLGIDWGVEEDAVTLSDKDRRHPRLRDYATPFAHGTRA